MITSLHRVRICRLRHCKRQESGMKAGRLRCRQRCRLRQASRKAQERRIGNHPYCRMAVQEGASQGFLAAHQGRQLVIPLPEDEALRRRVIGALAQAEESDRGVTVRDALLVECSEAGYRVVVDMLIQASPVEWQRGV